MSTEAQIQEIEMTIEQARKAKELMEAVLKLSNNHEFKRVINEDYFEKYAARLVLLKADPNMQDESSQRELNNNMIAIGYFRQYLSSLIQLGRQAEREILDAEEARTEILAEE
jgi:hypothetical protein